MAVTIKQLPEKATPASVDSVPLWDETGGAQNQTKRATVAALTAHDHDGTYEPAGSVAAHEAAGDPHGQYLQSGEAEPPGSIAAHRIEADAHDADRIRNVPAGGISSLTVQAAINELDAEKTSTGHGHSADDVSNTPAGNIASTTVQGAINELDAEKLGSADLSAYAQNDLVNPWTKQQRIAEQTLTDAANIAWNLEAAQTAVVMLGDNRTLDNPTNMLAGATYMLRIVQDATGGRTLAYGAAFLWPGGAAPVLSTDPDAIDILCFYSDGVSMYGVPALGFA